MRRGPWHQFGDRSQELAREQLNQGVGVGVIISPRDLSESNAVRRAEEYRALGAHVLIDQQFYVPTFSNRNLASYSISQYRDTISQLCQITDSDLHEFAVELERIHRALSADGLIAPALAYEAGRPDLVQLNSRLFACAKQVGDNIGIPTYATVVIGRSATSSRQTVKAVLSHATGLDSDGWYFAFEFESERVPSSRDAILQCCVAGLTLACTDKPVLHAYAGPMALLSLGFGATAAGVGHSQNLWKFTPGRWAPPPNQGGGGTAPPRFFSRSLWGTIVYPDEVALLSAALRSQVLVQSPFSTSVSANSPFLGWSRWEAHKHLVNMICSEVASMSTTADPRSNATAAITLLQDAINLHGNIAGLGISLRDDTNAYQENWRTALEELLSNHSGDYDYLALLG